MSSLAAAKADNFYYPPEWDPSKGNLDKFHGTHALGARAKRFKSEGVLIIRFEMPFNVWCTQCGQMIGKGVRFNAEKRHVGMYHSTKIWSFAMRHHCGNRIEIHTDPRKTEYRIIEGIRKKIENYSAEDAQVIDLGKHNDESLDALAAVERKETNRRKAKAEHARLAVLKEDCTFLAKNDAKLNRLMRNNLRPQRKDEKSRKQKRKALGLPDHVELLPEDPEDVALSKSVKFHPTPHKSHRTIRKDILKSSIFDKKSKRAARRKRHSAHVQYT